MSIPKLGSIGALIRQAASGPYWELLASLVGVSPPVLAQTNVQSALEALASVVPPIPPDYSTQTEWYIDEVSGNDANDGLTPATAVAGTSIITERLNGGLVSFQQNVTFTWLTSVTDTTQSLTLRPTIGQSAQLFFIGIPSAIIQVTLTSVVSYVVLTTRPSVTVAGFDWTPHVGKRCRRSTNNTTFWVEAVVSGDVTSAYISRPCTSGGGATIVAINDIIDIEDLPETGPISIHAVLDGHSRGSSVVLDFNALRFNTRIVPISLSFQALTQYGSAARGLVQSRFIACDIATSKFATDIADIFGSKFSSNNPTVENQIRVMGVRIHAALCSIQHNLVCDMGLFMADTSCSAQSSQLWTAANGNKRAAIFLTSFSSWDWPSGGGGAAGAALWIDPGALANVSNFWGTSTLAGTRAIGLSAAARCTIQTANSPLAGTLSTQYRVGNVDITASQLPFINPLNNSAIVEA